MNKEIDGKNLERFNENGKFGFKDKETGEVVIKAIYDDVAGSFSEGLAKVKLNDKFGFIDATGKVVVEIKYDYLAAFSEGLAYVALNDKFGFIDTTGKVVIEIEYDDADSFREGLATVSLNGKYCSIDATGVLYENGFSYVRLGDKYCFVKNGKVQELKYDYIGCIDEEYNSDDEIWVIKDNRLYSVDKEENHTVSITEEGVHKTEDYYFYINAEGYVVPFECAVCRKKIEGISKDIEQCDTCYKYFCYDCVCYDYRKSSIYQSEEGTQNRHCHECLCRVDNFRGYECVYMSPGASGYISGLYSLFKVKYWDDYKQDWNYKYDDGSGDFESSSYEVYILVYGNTPNSLSISSQTDFLKANVKEINCNGCGITQLEVDCEVLYCSKNDLKNLNVSFSKNLKILDCSKNDLEEKALNSLFESLHSETIEGKTITITGNPGAATCDRTIAEKKGWTVIG